MSVQDIIEPSTSPWMAPIILVKKKDGSSRFCVNYQKLNEITKKDLDTLGGSVWFSTVDLKSGYWQVELQDEDKEKTAFLWATGCGSSK